MRVGVLDCLAGSRQPLSVQQILEKLPPRTDSVTVYRTLNVLTDRKLVHRVQGDDRMWRYATGDPHDDRSRHAHAHFVCNGCGTVECLETSLPPGIAKSLRVDQGYDVSHSELVLHGTCPRCH